MDDIGREDEEGLRPAFHVGFTLDEAGVWVAALVEVAEHGGGASPLEAFQDLLSSLVESRDSLREHRPRLSVPLEERLAFLESIPHLDEIAAGRDLHAVH